MRSVEDEAGGSQEGRPSGARGQPAQPHCVGTLANVPTQIPPYFITVGSIPFCSRKPSAAHQASLGFQTMGLAGLAIQLHL